MFQCWLTCQLASVESLRSLEKTIDDPTPSWSAVLFLRLVVFCASPQPYNKRQPSQSDAHFARSSSSEFQIRGHSSKNIQLEGVTSVRLRFRCGVSGVWHAFFFHFQRMLTINHSLVQIADATTSANALDTSRLARQTPFLCLRCF